VNVPPRSIQKSHLPTVVAFAIVPFISAISEA
jgi:hypothetical protein